MTTGGAQSNWEMGYRRGEVAPEQGTIVGLVALGGLVGGEGEACGEP